MDKSLHTLALYGTQSIKNGQRNIAELKTQIMLKLDQVLAVKQSTG